jgi:HEPN domain-containing protein
MSDLPDLDRIFFADDDADHADDSCCLSLNRPFFSDDQAKWAELRDQHLVALSLLVEQRPAIGNEADGWWLARPLVFGAHHTVELGLKTATRSGGAAWPGNGHDLKKLLDLDRTLNGMRAATRTWENTFVVLLEDAWDAGRYPFEKDGAETMRDKCCVSASALFAAVVAFLKLVDTTP